MANLGAKLETKLWQWKSGLTPYFPTRQIILRAEGKTRQLTLSTNLQLVLTVLMFSVFMILLAWGGVSQWLYASQKQETAMRDHAILEAKHAYNDLIEDMKSHQKRLNSDLAEQLSSTEDQPSTDQKQSLDALAKTIDAFVTRLSVDVSKDDPLSHQIITSRNKLLTQLEDLQDELSDERQAGLVLSKAFLRLDELIGGASALDGEHQINVEEVKTLHRATKVDKQIDSLHQLYSLQLQTSQAIDEHLEQGLLMREAILAKTDVPVVKLLTLVGVNPAAGGRDTALEPLFNQLSGKALSMAHSGLSLEDKIARLNAMDKLLKCLPLNAPVDYYHLTSKFGKRKDPFNGRWANHAGLDLGGWPGIAIYAAADGKVTKAGTHAAYGKLVEIDHGCNVKTRYGHLKKIKVKKGDQLDYRSVIGTLGSTGRSTGPHVHFEIIINGQHVDPEPFIEAGRYVFKIIPEENQPNQQSQTSGTGQADRDKLAQSNN